MAWLTSRIIKKCIGKVRERAGLSCALFSRRRFRQNPLQTIAKQKGDFRQIPFSAGLEHLLLNLQERASPQMLQFMKAPRIVTAQI